jgi:hypothetical protein
MSGYVIDKGVPLPKNGSANAVYPWSEMEVGDSFFAAGKTAKTLSVAASSQRRRYGGKYIVRSVTENGVSGARVWRVS